MTDSASGDAGQPTDPSVPDPSVPDPAAPAESSVPADPAVPDPAVVTGQIKHGRLKRSHPLAGAAKIIAISLAVVLVSAVGVVAYAANSVVQTASPPVHLAHLPGHTAVAIPSAPAGQAVGEVNMLLIGTDTRTGQTGEGLTDPANQAASSGLGNNDVNILLHISADHTSISVVSFPRDLEIPIPSCPTASGGTSSASSKAMLNTALGRGGDVPHGLSCAVLTVEKLTGLEIPYAASVTFDGTAAISTAIGGVTVCLATPIRDYNVTPPIDLQPGQHTLVGADALSFLRSRHGVGDGSDLGRISNQQVFMSSLARQLSSGSTYANPFKLYAIASAAAKNMRLSDTLDVPTLLGIFQAVRQVGLSNMVFVQYPTGQDPDDINRVVPNVYAATALNEALIADRPLALSGHTGDAAVLDPSATASPSSPSPSSAAAAPTSPAPSSPSSSSPPGPPASPTAIATLPASVTGQTAADKTCSKKITY